MVPDLVFVDDHNLFISLSLSLPLRYLLELAQWWDVCSAHACFRQKAEGTVEGRQGKYNCSTDLSVSVSVCVCPQGDAVLQCNNAIELVTKVAMMADKMDHVNICPGRWVDSVCYHNRF